MPLRSEYVLRAVLASFTAVGVSHFVAYSTTFRFGYAFMQFRKPFFRSSPLIDARSPSSIATWPVPLECVPMYLHALWPYSRLSARTIMYTCPFVGATSTLTTGTCLLAAYASVGAIAALSTGLMMSAFTPWSIRVLICVACFAASPSDEIGPTSFTPYFVPACFSNATYELQKSVL